MVNRPNPEKLLQQVQAEEQQQQRGKLKIYLGAAPGVGKTYTMLKDALDKRAQGLDVVVGIVETHGRTEIESLQTNLEILPRQKVDYRGRQLLEFDLDAALKRSPGLILVDEMAHSNAPGLRHVKRWQDIQELLKSGIDVYTTLNVQHIESLNDDVAQIIQTQVQETVPDSMIEMADTVELIDLPPEDLLKRLKQGKVYIPEQANLAMDSFFRKGNLIALRELALRATAEHVGAEVLLYRQGQGIKQIWPTQEKILVCVGPGSESKKLIRAARRTAMNLQVDWIAVYVETPSLQAIEKKRNEAIQHLRLAEQLGAETRILSGFDIVKEIMNFAREQNITQIMIWKNIRSRWRNLFLRDLADEIVRHSGEIDIYIMTGRKDPTEKKASIRIKPSLAWKHYFIAMCMVVIVTAINFLLFPVLSPSNLIMIYLLGVVIVALFGRTGPSILASILSVLAYDFFFVPPLYSFAVSDIQYFFTLLVMLIITQLIGHLTILTRRQAQSARFAAQENATLHSLSRQLASTRGVDKLLETGVTHVAKLFNSDVSALMPEGNQLVIRARSGTEAVLDSKEQSVAQWVYDLGQVAGLGTETLTFSKAIYFPLIASQGTIGVLSVRPMHPENLFPPEKMRLLESFANQLALAIEVDRLEDTVKKKEQEIETDQARNALLQVVARNLRSPLVSSLGAASTLMEMADELKTAQIKKIGQDISNELEQLNRLINNFLQINYLESKNIVLQKKVSSLREVIHQALQALENKTQKRKIHIEMPDDFPHVPLDPILLQEVLFNLIDNALKFSTPESPIEIKAVYTADQVEISIRDHGPGIVPDEVNKLFEKYYRGRKLTTERGLGLGLAISKMIIEAHGGKIWVENAKQDQGAIFYFTLPLYS